MNTTQTLDQMQHLRPAGYVSCLSLATGATHGPELEGHDLIAHLLQSEELTRPMKRQFTV